MAEAEAEVRIVAQWQGRMPESWQAAKDFLERRYPGRWGHKLKTSQKIELTGEDGGPVEFSDARERLIERLASLLEGRLVSAEGPEQERAALPASTPTR